MMTGDEHRELRDALARFRQKPSVIGWWECRALIGLGYGNCSLAVSMFGQTEQTPVRLWLKTPNGDDTPNER